jgi:hypothetical protein
MLRKRVKTSFYIDDERLAKLKEISRPTMIPMSALMRKPVDYMIKARARLAHLINASLGSKTRRGGASQESSRRDVHIERPDAEIADDSKCAKSVLESGPLWYALCTMPLPSRSEKKRADL